MILLALLWLVGVVSSDLYNETTTTSALKGSFNIILMILDIPFVYWAFYASPKRVLYYWVGVGIGSLIQFYVFSYYESEFEYDVWRVYAYDVLVLALSGLLFYKNRILLSLLLAEGFAIWSLFHSSRNIFLCTTIAASLLIFIVHVKKTNIDKALSNYKKNISWLFISLLVGAFVASNAYEYAAGNGYLGERAYDKYIMQKYTDAGLASGRVDFLISWELIKDNPIWGYGSYALDKEGVKEKYLIEHEYYVGDERKDSELLPGHSYFLGAWVYAGILSVPFWLYILYLVFYGTMRGTFLRQPRIMGLAILLIISYLWKILFSPFADRILFMSFVMILILLKSDNVFWRMPQESKKRAVTRTSIPKRY